MAIAFSPPYQTHAKSQSFKENVNSHSAQQNSGFLPRRCGIFTEGLVGDSALRQRNRFLQNLVEFLRNELEALIRLNNDIL